MKESKQEIKKQCGKTPACNSAICIVISGLLTYTDALVGINLVEIP